MTLKLILSFITSLILHSSVLTAQTKKEIKAMAKQVQEENKRQKKLTVDATNGNVEAAYELGIIYFVGINTSPKYDSAFKYIAIAQQGGYPEAMYKTGEFWQYGVSGCNGCNVEHPNRNEAIIWYKNAAAKGYQPAIDKVKDYQIVDNNPVQLADSFIIKGNYDEALKYLKLAAEYNNDPRAMYKISQLYLHRQLSGVEQYPYWLKKAADNMYTPAFLELGFYYEKLADANNDKIYRELAWDYFYKAGMYGDKTGDAKRKEYYARYKEELDKAERERSKYSATNSGVGYSSGLSKISTTVTKKTCPICNGTGKITDRYTSEKRDWNNKTITMTDHVTSKACSRCNGQGYYTY
ncbi:MAG: hypothetical protein ABIN01_10645 [Ferruginibacter sp.]